MTRERSEERRRHAGRNDRLRRAQRAAGCLHDDRLASERHLLHGRSFEELCAAFRGLRRQAEARAVRIQRGAVSVSQAAVSRCQRQLIRHGPRVQHRRIKAGRATRLLIFLQPEHLVRRRRHGERRRRAEIALDVETPEQRREIERRAPPRLPRPPRRAQAERALDLHERDARLIGHPAGSRPGAAASDPIRFEQRNLDAGGGTRVRRRAPGQAAADDDGVGLEMAAVTGMRRDARFGKAIDPRRSAVLSHGACRLVTT